MTPDMMAPTADIANRNQLFTPEPGQKRRFLTFSLVFVAASILLGFVGVTYDDGMQKWLPETSGFPSTYNKKPSGTSGLAEIVARCGLASRLWLLPYRQLGITRGTLCVFGPLTSFKEFEVDQILTWVKSGNQLIYMDHFSYSLSRHMLEKLHIDTVDGASLKDAKFKQNSDIGVLSHVPSLIVSADTRLKGGEQLLSDKTGNLLTRLHYGKGDIILGTVPSLCANKRLTDKAQWGNFQFLINVCRTHGGEIIFDERCHGYHQASNVFVFFAKNAPGAVFAQMVLMLALGIFGSFHRFGKTKELFITRRLSSLDFIGGLSSVYRRAHANLLALEIISRSYRTRWCKITNAAAHDSDAELKEKWAQISAGNEPLKKWSLRAGAVLTRISEASTVDKLNDHELLELTTDLEKLDHQLNEIFLASTSKGVSK